MKFSERLTRFLQGTVVTIALSFLVVGYVPSINFSGVRTPVYGLGNADVFPNGELEPGTGLSVPADYDKDGFFGDEDGCPSTYGTASMAPLVGCPDSDGDGYADKGVSRSVYAMRWNDVCPNNPDHKQCLKVFGLATYPKDYDLMVCRDLQEYENDLTNARYLAIAAGVVGAILLAIPGVNIVVIQVLIVSAALTGLVGGTLATANTSNALGNLQSVRAQLQGLGRCP